MKVEEKLHWFWATGILPGTMFEDRHNYWKGRESLIHRRVNWPERVGLRRTGKGFVWRR
jgi:hypothetical protein